jgi:hypothetical protein
VGSTASIGPGAWWITKPIQLLPASVAPTGDVPVDVELCLKGGVAFPEP